MPPRPPGFLSSRINPDVVMMICTAGHVDHGKTQLVKLLTGCNTDRLKEEQERGLTIDLGFAPCYLGGNLCVGIVDVPGHEKFVKNMVAGVSGIEMTVLVIAADDGVMPQTVEHLQIMELLGVRKGMVALTKIDLVTPERVQQVSDEIRGFLKGTFLDGCPICPVSSETFDGYPEFYETLVGLIQSLQKKRRAGIFRMPVERVFTQQGFGAVVTGIPVAGTVSVGDEVELVPGDQRGKIRGVQRFLRDATQGEYGQCLALNVPDFGKKPPVRGQVLATPGYLKAAVCFHLRLVAVAGLDKPLRNAEEIKFHTGTAEEPGKMYLLEQPELAESQTGLATVILHNPVAAAAHDRFIIRRASPARTVAGGEILAVSLVRERPRKAEAISQLKELLAAFQGVDLDSPEGMDKRVEHIVRRVRRTGGSIKDISQGTMLPRPVIRESVSRLVAAKRVLALAEDYFIHAEAYAKCLDSVKARVQRASAQEKLLSLSVADLHKDFDWPAPLWTRMEQELEQAKLLQKRADKYVLPGSVQAMPDADRALMMAILRVYTETGFHSPRPDELPEILHAPEPRVARLLQHLYNEGQLLRLSPHVVLTREWFKKAQEMVVQIIREKGTLDSGEFKNNIQSTRKYALAILDFLDARRVTVRIGNNRKLIPDYQRNLV